MVRIMVRMLLVALALAFLAPLVVGQQSSPDLILLKGRVFTSDASHPYVEALAIRGDRIVAAGTSEKIASMSGPQTKRLDLGGRPEQPNSTFRIKSRRQSQTCRFLGPVILGGPTQAHQCEAQVR